MAAEHRDYSGQWGVKALHDMPHKTWTPFGDTFDPTPQNVYDSPYDFAQSVGWTPGWTIAVAFVVSIGLYMTVMGLACCRTCKPTMSRRVWMWVSASLGVLVLGSYLVSAVFISHNITSSLSSTLHVADDIKEHYDTSVATVHELSDEVQGALVAANTLLVANVTDQQELQDLISTLQSANETSVDIVNQIDQDIDSQQYVDDADYYIGITKSSVIGWVILQGLLISGGVVVMAVRASRPETDMNLKPYRWAACGIGAVAMIIFALSLGTTAGAWSSGTAIADVCVQPYGFIDVVLNQGNTSNTDIATYYSECTDATGGPVNENIDTIYSQVSSAANTSQHLYNVTLNNPASTPADISTARDMVSNITAAQTNVNVTRTLVDCRVAHGFSEDVLHKLCGDYVPASFIYAVFGLATTVLVPIFLIVVAADVRDYVSLKDTGVSTSLSPTM